MSRPPRHGNHQVANQCHYRRGTAGRNRATVLAKDDIFDPMQRILNAPMRPNPSLQGIGLRCPTGDVVALLQVRLPVASTRPPHFHPLLSTRPQVLERGRQRKDRSDASGLTSTGVFGIEMNAQERLALCRLLSLLMQCFLIGFDTDHVVIALAVDEFDGFF